MYAAKGRQGGPRHKVFQGGGPRLNGRRGREPIGP